MALVERAVTVRFDLANGVFAGGGNSVTLSGLRVQAVIAVPGGKTMSTVEGAIYGAPLSVMNQLSTVGTQLNRIPNNKVTVMAGDAVSGMAVVYQGTLQNAFVDAQAMPSVALRFTGMEGLYESVMPVAPTSVEGAGDVATMMGGLAGQMGLQFETNGVNVKLNNPYFYSSPRQQVLDMAEHAGIEHVISRGKLAIWSPSQARQGSPVLIALQTGMVGYPQFNQRVVYAKTLFNPTVDYGNAVQIQSDLAPACGMFKVIALTNELDALTPHGRWFTTVQGVPLTAQEIDP